MSSQEIGDIREDLTQEQLREIIASQKEMLDRQAAMISNLTQELQTLKTSLSSQITQVPTSMASSEPRMTFASALFTTIPNISVSGAAPSVYATMLFTASGGGAKLKSHQERP